jgi:integral membrane protein
MKTNTLLGQFRIIAFLEGVSYLLLFGVGMPLKYWMDIPQPNYIIGLLHGFLFICYIAWLLVIWIKLKWSFIEIFLSFIASLLPFGTFIADYLLFSKKQTD